jgi:hypothetical protein
MLSVRTSPGFRSAGAQPVPRNINAVLGGASIPGENARAINAV